MSTRALTEVLAKATLRASRPMWRAAASILNLKGTNHG